jgi:hypothetical protein
MVRVKPPDFFPGMFIVFLVNAVTTFVALVAGAAFAAATAWPIRLENTKDLLELVTINSVVIAALLNPIISAIIFSIALEDCGFFWALLVWLAQFVALALLIGLIVGIFYVVTQTGPAPPTSGRRRASASLPVRDFAAISLVSGILSVGRPPPSAACRFFTAGLVWANPIDILTNVHLSRNDFTK